MKNLLSILFFVLIATAYTNAQVIVNFPLKGGGGGTGSVTSVSALTIGTTGTDLSSTVADSTTTPVITLNVPTASATNRGALSAADWTTFNNKADNSNVMHLTGSLNETADGIKTFTQDVFIHTGITAGRGGSNIFSNVVFGDSALRSNTTGYQNTAFGRLALFSNTTGNRNIAIGDSALYSTTTSAAIYNVAVGFRNLVRNTTGYQNIAIGALALLNNTTGQSNVASGYTALQFNTTGSFNVAYGIQTIYSNITGLSNTGLGAYALSSNTTGNQNTGLGRGALFSDSSGSNNVAAGFNAGRYIGTGTTANAITDNSIYIGRLTKAAANNQINQIVIGDSTTGDGSNTTVIGNALIIQARINGTLINGSGVQYALLVNPAFSGVPTAPTAASGTNTTQLATTQFVTTAIALAQDSIKAQSGIIIDTFGVIGSGGYKRIILDTTYVKDSIYWPYVKLTTDQTIDGLKSFQGAASSDGAIYSAEQLTTASGSNWSGSSLPTGGYTHTPGSTTALTSSYTSGTLYFSLVITATGTTGSCTVTFGGVSLGTLNAGGSIITSPKAISNTALVITPTSAFDGVVTASAKYLTPGLATTSWKNSSGTVVFEIRAPLSNTNQISGLNAGTQITTGTSNTAIGNLVLRYNTSGGFNSIVGFAAMTGNNTGSNNSGLGSYVLTNNTTGNQNSVIGDQAGYSNTTGGQNQIFGYKAMYGNTTGSGNVAIGADALRFRADGTTLNTIVNNSVGIGTATRTLADNQTNQNMFGYQTIGRGSNTSTYGNTSIVSHGFNGDVILLGTTNKIQLAATFTPALTTGNQTINKPAGRVNFAAGTISIVVTNSLVNTTSIVNVQVQGTDATAKTATVTVGSGSFTITLNAPATAETPVTFNLFRTF